MKKTIFLLVAFLALGFCGYYLVKNNQETGVSSLSSSDRDFNVKDLESLGKITLEMKKYNPITLEKIKGTWYVNNRYKVAKPQLENLFNSISRLSLKYIPHSNAKPVIMEDFEKLGIHVSIYDESNKKLKSYTVGAGAENERGTFFLMDGATQPYAMELLQFEGSVRGRFFMNELAWRDRTMLSQDASDVASITVEYPRQKNISFKLDVENDEVSPVFKYALKATSKPRAGSVKAYLRGFENIIAENIETGNEKKDSIVNSDFFCKISIDRKEGKDIDIKFYPLAGGQLAKASQARQEETDIIERYFAVCSWGEMFLVQQRLIGKIFQPIEFFYEVEK